MRKLITATLTLAATTFAYAIEEVEYTRGNHRIYVEPDISFDLIEKMEDERGTWESHGEQYGVKVGYEFFKPNSIYAELLSVNALGNVHRRVQSWEGETFRFERGTSRQNFAGHLGYALQFEDMSLAPFTGLGWSSWKDSEYLSQIAYIPIGIKAQFTVVKNMIYTGLKCERLQYIHSWHRAPGEDKQSNSIWAENECGYEISVPLTFFSAESQGGWYTSVEPYFLRLYDHFAIIGGRIATARQF